MEDVGLLYGQPRDGINRRKTGAFRDGRMRLHRDAACHHRHDSRYNDADSADRQPSVIFPAHNIMRHV